MSGVDLLWSLIEKGKAGKNIGKTTGLPKLDKIIGGIQPHRYYLVGAGSSVGKTSFIMYIIYHVLRKEDPENPIYFWYASLEIGEDVFLAKLMSLYIAEEFSIYLTLNDILSFETPLNDFAYNCLKSAKKWINEIYDYITIFDRSLGANTLYNQTLEFAEKYGHFEEDDLGNKKTYIPNNPNQLMIGVLDHFALIRCTEGRTLKQEIDLMSSYMVTLKRKLPLSWFVLMQQNRESSSMDRRKADLSEPGLNDLKDFYEPELKFIYFYLDFC